MSDNADKVQWKGRWQFVENILGLSLTKEPDKLHEEWKFQRKFEDPTRNGQCICGTSHLKYGFRFSNSSTGHVIMTGKECAKKLKLNYNGSGNNQFISAFMNGDINNGSWTAFTKITDIYTYSLDQRADWKELLDKELKFLYSKSLKQIESLVVELKDFHDILQRNAISDPKVVDIIRQVEKRQEGLIKYREEQREKARQDAAHNAELYRVAHEKHIKEKEEEMKRLEEEAREKERLRQEAEKQRQEDGKLRQEAREKERLRQEAEKLRQEDGKLRQEDGKQGILKRQAILANGIRLQAETKCTCGRSLLAEVCKCKHPQFTQRTLFGKTILCSKCTLKKCGCSNTS
jgi:hypothetical protein